MEQTKTNAGAFVDAAKLQMDGGFRNITNNIAMELFGDGSGVRGTIDSGTGAGTSGNPYLIQLDNAQEIVNFEVGMTLQNVTISSGTVTINNAGNTGSIVSVNRATGVIGVVAVVPDASWLLAGNKLVVAGDIQAGALSTSSFEALSGLAAWLPVNSPASNDSFWGVNRSADPTRLAGLRYDARAYTIEEGLTNALAFLNREGGKPDLAIMDFESYAALVNALGAKVQYVQVKHDEVEVAFEGITFQSAYGRVTVLADRNCQPNRCYLLTMSTWKLRSLGKVPHILTYGMEGLEGLRVGNADALEIRIGYYGNLICSAPGWNCVVQLSS